jgi:hypothetical protein
MTSDCPDAWPLTVLSDHGQFYLTDLGAHSDWMRLHGTDPDLAPAGWTEEAVYGHRIGVEPFSVSIGTARDATVEVEVLLRVVPAAPAADPGAAEHIVEADLGLPSGDLAIYGPADDPGSEQHVHIAPGHYRIRVSYRHRGLPEKDADDPQAGRDFLYQVDLWPAAVPAPVTVLKQGPRSWGWA